MTLSRVTDWRKLPLSLSELCIDTTLRCGQSFRWRKVNDEWTCALHGRILSLKQDASFLHYKVTWPISQTYKLENDLPTPPASVRIKQEDEKLAIQPQDKDDTEDLLRHYMSLKLDLAALYEQWSQADANFKKRAPKFEGVRILSQDAWETLICFICSSNNNIARISQMVHKLCVHYGPLIGHVHDEAFHDFPPPEALTGDRVESHLRELGFGYRAKYIAQTAKTIVADRPKGWLDSLTNPSNPNFRPAPESSSLPSVTYKEAHEQLLGLTGVGPKVADCVCLMGLGWGEAVPVDTHVWQIAQRDYKFGKGKSKTTTLNRTVYDAVGDHFRGLWGEYAGWAHSVLFTADLKVFSDRSTAVKKETGTPVVVKKEEHIEELDKASPKKRKGAGVKIETEVVVKKEEDQVETLMEVKRRRVTRSSTRAGS